MVDKELIRYIKFINHVLEKPGVYAVNRIEDISYIELGYRIGLHLQNEPINNFINGFRSWVNNHFDSKQNYGWEQLIRLHSQHSDSHSLKLMRELFSRYLEELGITETLLR